MRLKKIILLAACWCVAGVMYGQQASKKEAIEALQQLVARYRAADHLSFNINYRYALESKPGEFLDSMRGSFKMHGLAYWYSIDSTESIVSKDYTLMLFKEDKIMYVAKPSAAVQDKNPLSLPDSVYLNSDAVKCSMEMLEREKKITLEFRPGAACKKIEYYINKRTGMADRVVSYVQSSQLYDPSVRQVVDASVYAVMEMRFSNYREKSFDDAVLNMSKYFTKQGKEFTTVSPYESYKIFLGSPNL
jgi:outer membrane lipoprotein-sorting protein